MKRFIPVFLVLALVLSASLAGAVEPVPVHIHLVVVTETLPDGSSARDLVPEFEREVVLKLAGGFTELGPTRGGDIVNGGVVYQNSLSFIIGASHDISQELHELTKKLFGAGAFIMAWPGTMTY